MNTFKFIFVQISRAHSHEHPYRVSSAYYSLSRIIAIKNSLYRFEKRVYIYIYICVWCVCVCSKSVLSRIKKAYIRSRKTYFPI